MQKLLTFFFSKNNCVYAIFNDQNFNDMITNDIVSFEQLGPLIFNVFIVFEKSSRFVLFYFLL